MSEYGKCNSCSREETSENPFVSVIFGFDPKSYENYFINQQICTICLQKISATLNYNFIGPNETLFDRYDFLKKDGFIKLDDEREDIEDEDGETRPEVFFVIGVMPMLHDDYHILKIDSKFEEAIDFIKDILYTGARDRKIKSWRDLVRYR